MIYQLIMSKIIQNLRFFLDQKVLKYVKILQNK